MNEQQIYGVFAEFDPGHPFYMAVLQLLDNAIATEQDGVIQPKLTDAERHFNAGRLAFAKDFRGMLPDTTREAVVRRVKEAQRQAAAHDTVR